MIPTDVTRIREYLARQARARSTIWPAYRRALEEAPDVAHALAADESASSALRVEFGADAPLILPFDTRLRAHMLRAFDYRCAYCGRPLPVVVLGARRPSTTSELGWTPGCALDHVDPRALGGVDGFTNFVPACRRCNTQKGARRPEDWDGPK